MAIAAWPGIEDEALVERLIPAIQRTIADVCAAEGRVGTDDWIPVGIADLSNVLLMLLATVVEPLPVCATPRGTRLFAEETARQLAAFVRDARAIRIAAATGPETFQ